MRLKRFTIGTTTSPPSMASAPVLMGDLRMPGIASRQKTPMSVKAGARMKHAQHEAAVTFFE